jgi:hypothetical protein
MEEREVEFNPSLIKAFIGKEKFFIDKNGEVDKGKIKKITVDEAGSIDKISIQGSKKATVTTSQLFETLELALMAAVSDYEERISTLINYKESMQRRLTNHRKELPELK